MTYENYTQEKSTSEDIVPWAELHFGSDCKNRIRYVTVQPPWWNHFAVGWVAGLLYCLAMDLLLS